MRPAKLGFSLWSQATSWPAFRDAAVRIDALGFDYLFTQDHLLATFGDEGQDIYEGWTLITAVAPLTSHVQLGLLVAANTFRNPGLMAKAAVTLDHISNGRAVLGIGGAWHQPEHTAHGIDFGVSPGDRLRRLDAAVRGMRALLDGDAANVDEPSVRLPGVRHRPLPLAARLPILVGGSGEQKTLLTTARYADIWNGLGSVETLRHKMAVLDAHCAAERRDPAEIERSVTVKMVIRDDPAEARRVWEAALTANRTRLDVEPDPWLGAPDMIAERARAYLAIGVTTVIVSMPNPYDTETIERLAREVQPLLAN